jgi:hypothetical protein
MTFAFRRTATLSVGDVPDPLELAQLDTLITKALSTIACLQYVILTLSLIGWHLEILSPLRA